MQCSKKNTLLHIRQIAGNDVGNVDGCDAGRISLQQRAVGILDKHTGRERHAGIAGRFFNERNFFTVMKNIKEIFKQVRIVFLNKLGLCGVFIRMKAGREHEQTGTGTVQFFGKGTYRRKRQAEIVSMYAGLLAVSSPAILCETDVHTAVFMRILRGTQRAVDVKKCQFDGLGYHLITLSSIL